MTDSPAHRRQLVEYCHHLYQRGLVGGTQGNVSIRSAKNNILITPTGKNLGFLKASDLVTMSLKGERKAGKYMPSSEHNLHTGIYRSRPDINAVVHAHPIAATACALAGIDMNQPILPEIIITFGKIPLIDYGTPGTPELFEKLKPQVDKHTAFLLQNHGAVTLGHDLEEAFNRMEMLERYAQVMLMAHRAGKIKKLTAMQVSKLTMI